MNKTIEELTQLKKELENKIKVLKTQKRTKKLEYKKHTNQELSQINHKLWPLTKELKETNRLIITRCL